MSIQIAYLLKFSDVFSEERGTVASILSDVPKSQLMRLISLKHNNTLNYNNFFSTSGDQIWINEKVTALCKERGISVKNVEVLSDLAFLKIIEVILSKGEELYQSEFDEELFNMKVFKSFLIVNEELEIEENAAIQKIDRNTSKEFQFASFMLLNQFPASDTELNKDELDILKYIYATVHKFELQFEFLEQHHSEIMNKILTQFKFEDKVHFIKSIKDFLMILFIQMRRENGNSVLVKDVKDIQLFDSLIAEKVEIIEDFQRLKEHPLVKLEDKEYTYIDFLFVVDRFYKGIKFNFMSFFNNESSNKKQFGDFFSYYNLEFSEKYLFRALMDEIFQDDYFYTLTKDKKEYDDEPDYYVRTENTVLIFENKDILIDKSIKSNRDIEKLMNVLKKKLLLSAKPVGIGQLISHISKMLHGEFLFDKGIDHSTYTIYPVLVLHERIFDILGLNYILNEWYREELKSKLGTYNNSRLRGLTIIDIDTFIALKGQLIADKAKFIKLLDMHINELEKPISFSFCREEKERKYQKKLAPFSHRIERLDFTEELLSKYKHIKE